MNKEQIEAAIYNTFYKNNPEGDARWSLWPEVIRAKKEKQAKKALTKILTRLKKENK